ncbi:glycosyltransferase involved in cell wall biosynthesis [Hydrogenispora ethanolica]|jgi:glycosyltransferase involved in cell wall biosynthesis|uniref:Glycosyltransferase involved in cell wall biosynthesis n=1 Tax=Hydrogenispora ethanolica TaxID=1082276 RepID=A0A4R1R4E3_HYDET|nr:glycosyltransferase [Hydrogenispora ethanolica]TCL60270.1 glycosyltransferase involved in cell wall biosynthesis [Hydrogenispora ethanolica]
MLTFLYPPTIDWFYLYQRPQQLFAAFARLGCKAIFCNYPHYIPQDSGVQLLAPGLFLVNRADPNLVPRDEEPLLWITYPPHVRTLDRYPHRAVLFDAVDEPTEEFSHWQASAAEIVDRSVLVFASSGKIVEYYAGFGRPVYLVPNGVDYEHFSQNKTAAVPFDLRRIPRPRVCYSGALAQWVDWEMVADAARQAPKISFVFVGPSLGALKLPAAPNLYYLGIKPYAVLPSYLHHCDVLMIPFRISSMTRACNPIKFWEYLATGIPIVSTSLPEVAAFEGVGIADGAAEFIEAIQAALATGQDQAAKAQRMKLARQNDWQQRARTIISLIRQHGL